ncbi:EcsC family protein [Pontibacillus halophilus]|uniref:EcsC family protein n=1 Tax=Pontibacillus halophilus TaxID=516704 RepID=UPI00047AEFF4|nr:EcsC family protein [Pontibacillus halophilus]
MSKERVIHDIRSWEEQWEKYRANDFELMYDQWLRQSVDGMGEKSRKRMFHQIDQWLFHTHSYIHGTAFQSEARERILTSGRIFNEEVHELHDMKKLSIDQLSYLAHQHMSKGKIYSFAQGGLTGTGGFILLGVDFPLMMILNLRAVQLISLTFGYEVNHPYEMMISLKVFHAATLPKRLQRQAWNELKEEIKHQDTRFPYFYEGDEELADVTWLEQPLRQLTKTLFIVMFRKKLIQGLPIVSMVAGATMNYQLTRQVTEFALRFYQYRNLYEQGELS